MMTLIFRKFLCLVILIALGMVGINRGLTNPPTTDYRNSEGNPTPADQETPVYLKEEFVNITLTSSKAFVNAFYTFKNNNSDPIEISIILPFRDLSKKSNEAKAPEDHVRILNSTNLTYEWKEINLEGIVEYGGDEFRAIEFQLLFSGNEEEEVWIYYSRVFGD